MPELTQLTRAPRRGPCRRGCSICDSRGCSRSSRRFVCARSSQLNRLTLVLSPVALGSVFLYSYTKRFTSLSHFVLGWCLAIAPSGAWIAIQGNSRCFRSSCHWLLCLDCRFDVLYACQDYEFDRRAGFIRSLSGWGQPGALGRARNSRAYVRRVGVLLLIADLSWLVSSG